MIRPYIEIRESGGRTIPTLPLKLVFRSFPIAYPSNAEEKYLQET